MPELLPAPMAYFNPEFLNSPGWSGSCVILSEYQEPLSRFRREKIQDTVVFACRSAPLLPACPTRQNALTILEKPGSAKPASPQQQPGARRWRCPASSAEARPCRHGYGQVLRRCASLCFHADGMVAATEIEAQAFCSHHRRRTGDHGSCQSGSTGGGGEKRSG